VYIGESIGGLTINSSITCPVSSEFLNVIKKKPVYVSKVV